MRWITVLAVFCLGAACGKESRTAPPPSSPEGAAKSFVAALARGDVEAARKMLPDETTCQSFAGPEVGSCLESLPALRLALPKFAIQLQSFEAERWTPQKLSAPAGIRLFQVQGKKTSKTFDIVTFEKPGDIRVAFPLTSEPPGSPPPPG